MVADNGLDRTAGRRPRVAGGVEYLLLLPPGALSMAPIPFNSDSRRRARATAAAAGVGSGPSSILDMPTDTYLAHGVGTQLARGEAVSGRSGPMQTSMLCCLSAVAAATAQREL